MTLRIMMFFISAFFLLLIGCASDPFLKTAWDRPVKNTDTKIWMDFDPACGSDQFFKDVDDCIAYELARASGLNIIGMSTTKGNASASDTYKVARDLVHARFPLYRGGILECGTPAVEAIAQAAIREEFTILALGTLTNVAAFLVCHPQLKSRVTRIVFVGGRRPGQELAPNPEYDATLVLRDLNVEEDPDAVRIVLRSEVPITLVPFEAAQSMPIQSADFAEWGVQFPAPLADRVASWSTIFSLQFGTNGFFPFDPVATGYIVWQDKFDCDPVDIELVGRHLIATPQKNGTNEYCILRDPKGLKASILGTLAEWSDVS